MLPIDSGQTRIRRGCGIDDNGYGWAIAKALHQAGRRSVRDAAGRFAVHEESGTPKVRRQHQYRAAG
jgi:hypothetical protein